MTPERNLALSTRATARSTTASSSCLSFTCCTRVPKVGGVGQLDVDAGEERLSGRVGRVRGHRVAILELRDARSSRRPRGRVKPHSPRSTFSRRKRLLCEGTPSISL